MKRRVHKLFRKLIIPVLSVLSLIWILIRVIPKPERATYPCMKVAFPFASSLIIYLTGIIASLIFFKKAYRKITESRYLLAGILMVVALSFILSVTLINTDDVLASEAAVYEYVDPLGANNPIGEAKGIMPGRVVWIYNADATNENCTPWDYLDGYFLDKNANQVVIDEMLSEAILDVSGAENLEDAWEGIFRYFNITHEKGDVEYVAGEKIFIKINAVHAWTTNEDLSIKLDDNYGKVDTSPQVILAVLRQLIIHGGVPEEAIYIGDPYTNIFKHLYNKLHAEFPNVHYMSRGDHENREKLKTTNTERIKFSDKGKVLPAEEDSFYDCTINADYILSLPAMKGHRGGGVTFFAKNHFGTNTQDGAAHMHKGLHKGTGDPLRGDYKMYRVFVDLMAYEHLGGKNLIYIGDFLWGTSMEHDPPIRFKSAPFNNDWTSSLMVSLDPVAISSVAMDIYQEEFQEEDLDVYPQRHTYVRFTAVDDYLHQAASSEWWPEGITYDPEGDGSPIGSLGVHEHWNNSTSRQYSRNLGTGNGIELVYKNLGPVGVEEEQVCNPELEIYFLSRSNSLQIELPFDTREPSLIKVFDLGGRLMHTTSLSSCNAFSRNTITLERQLPTGYYLVSLFTEKGQFAKPVLIE